MHTDNPAGRLLNILIQGKEKNQNAGCKDVWFEILEVQKNDLALLMSRLGKVTQPTRLK